MDRRHSLAALGLTMLLGAALSACGSSPAAPGSPAAQPTAAPAATVAPAPLPSATAAPGVDSAPQTPEIPVATAMPLPVATLPALASTALGGVNLPQETVSGAIADLASRLSLTPADISIVSADPVEWSDGSLGCPQPGLMYPQVITEGVRVILSAGGKQYAYHGDTQGRLFYCENPTR